jgi:DNA-binding PadR family transcriptional regulator
MYGKGWDGCCGHGGPRGMGRHGMGPGAAWADPGGGGHGFGHGRGWGYGPGFPGGVRTATLALLAEGPLHGYQIMQAIAERSQGLWRPSPGAIYPTLQQLEDEGLVVGEAGDGRRVYRLTESGRRYVEERRQELNRVWESLAEPGDEGFLELRSLAMQVMAAATQVAFAGSARQRAQAQEALAETRRRLYHILAEAPGSGPGDGT